MDIIDQFSLAIRAYEGVVARKRSTISTLMFNDGKRLDSIMSRRVDPRVGTLAGAMQWLSDHWPDGAVWPVEVPRPAPFPLDGETSPPSMPSASDLPCPEAEGAVSP